MCARVRAYDDRKFTSPKLSFLCEEEGNLFLFLVHSEDVLHQNTHTHKHGRAGRRCLNSANFWVNSVVLTLPDGVRPALSKDLKG